MELQIGIVDVFWGGQGAKLLTLEKDVHIAAESIENFVEYKIAARVVICDAVVEVEKLVQKIEYYYSFDLIFLDFAKKLYINVLENGITILKVGGFLIADNITFLGCLDYRKRVMEHFQLKTEIVMILDRFACSQKISSY